jgi:hypothetical protein
LDYTGERLDRVGMKAIVLQYRPSVEQKDGVYVVNIDSYGVEEACKLHPDNISIVTPVYNFTKGRCAQREWIHDYMCSPEKHKEQSARRPNQKTLRDHPSGI